MPSDALAWRTKPAVHQNEHFLSQSDTCQSYTCVTQHRPRGPFTPSGVRLVAFTSQTLLWYIFTVHAWTNHYQWIIWVNGQWVVTFLATGLRFIVTDSVVSSAVTLQCSYWFCVDLHLTASSRSHPAQPVWTVTRLLTAVPLELIVTVLTKATLMSIQLLYRTGFQPRSTRQIHIIHIFHLTSSFDFYSLPLSLCKVHVTLSWYWAPLFLKLALITTIQYVDKPGYSPCVWRILEQQTKDQKLNS